MIRHPLSRRPAHEVLPEQAHHCSVWGGLLLVLAPGLALAGSPVPSADTTRLPQPLAVTASPAASPAFPAGGAPALRPVDDLNLVLLEVQLDGNVLAEAITTYQVGRETFFPLGELARLLTLAIRTQPDRGTADGFVLSEARGFSLNVAQARLALADQTQMFDPALVRLQSEDIYVASALLSRWLPLDFEVNLSSLTLQVRPRERLPLQERLERERLGARAGARTTGYEDPGYPRQDMPYRLLGMPFIDQTLGVGLRTGSGSRQTSANYTAHQRRRTALHQPGAACLLAVVHSQQRFFEVAPWRLAQRVGAQDPGRQPRRELQPHAAPWFQQRAVFSHYRSFAHARQTAAGRCDSVRVSAAPAGDPGAAARAVSVGQHKSGLEGPRGSLCERNLGGQPADLANIRRQHVGQRCPATEPPGRRHRAERPAGLQPQTASKTGNRRARGRQAQWRFDALPKADSGAASVRVFLDDNANGVMDSGEEPIENVAMTVNGSRALARTDAAGIAWLDRLPTRQHVDIAVDTQTLEDPYWAPQRKGVRLVPRPGRVAELDFPVVLTSEIDGTVFLVEKASRRGIDVAIELLDLDRKLVSAIKSSWDGYYILFRR